MSTIALLECVPNISEGQDHAVVQPIAQSGADSGSRLLHVDIGYDANRSVLTYVGTPEQIEEAAFEVCAASALHIDMRKQHGSHPRIGAMDVCPIIPLHNADSALAIEVARKVARRIGSELGLPVFLYGEAAEHEYRKSLSDIRRGEYEGLKEKMEQVEWHPDFGPKTPSERFGATAVGVRKLLIAYNVSLATRELAIAKKIATAVRHLHPSVKAIGWDMPEYGCCQVSMNLLSYQECGLAEAFLACCREAKRFSVEVSGSEVVGMLPRQALLDAGGEFVDQQGAGSDSELLQAAIKHLGLDLHGAFVPEERILEFHLEDELPETPK